MSGKGEKRERSRLAAVLLSALACPGVGQIYKRHYVRGGLLVLASLALVSAFLVKAWAAAMEIMISTPPEQILANLMGTADAVIEKEAGFFTWSGYLLFAVWVYGILDAALTKARPGKSEREGVA